jgi:hypothetical protein
MGELDKANHPVIQPIAGGKEPDFVWHEPGKEQNIAIVEVKALARFPKGSVVLPRIIADTTKLCDFLNPRIHYRRAIQLLYGPADIQELAAIRGRINKAAGDFAAQFVVLWHPGPASMVQVIE